jgi:hypothetical protein
MPRATLACFGRIVIAAHSMPEAPAKSAGT